MEGTSLLGAFTLETGVGRPPGNLEFENVSCFSDDAFAVGFVCDVVAFVETTFCWPVVGSFVDGGDFVVVFVDAGLAVVVFIV